MASSASSSKSIGTLFLSGSFQAITRSRLSRFIGQPHFRPRLAQDSSGHIQVRSIYLSDPNIHSLRGWRTLSITSPSTDITCSSRSIPTLAYTINNYKSILLQNQVPQLSKVCAVSRLCSPCNRQSSGQDSTLSAIPSTSQLLIRYSQVSRRRQIGLCCSSTYHLTVSRDVSVAIKF